MRFLVRLFRWLFGVAQNADGSALTEIGGTGEDMDNVTLHMGQAKSYRIVPNKNDVTVEDVTKNIGGSATSDGFVGLSDYVSEPGNPLALTLTPEAPTAPGVPSILNWSFDSDTEGGVQTVVGSAAVTVLPENADDSSLQEIV